jgi:UDP-N-acetylmuramate--alanine ligase
MTEKHSIHTAKNIHFTGIKGVGMTAAALCAQDMGANVTGSDVKDTFVTDEILKKRGIFFKGGFKPENVNIDTDLVIYTGAHHGQNNPEVIYAQNQGITAISQAEAVGQLMQSKKGISVCGVGGKTSTSSMIATIFEHAQKNPSYLIGVARIPSLPAPGKYVFDSQVFIAEADEYITSPGSNSTPRFMYQNPSMIVCTNIAHDHPDAYKDIVQVKSAYQAFFAKVPEKGTIIANGDCQNSKDVLNNNPKVIFVGFSETADCHITKSLFSNGEHIIEFVYQGKTYQFTIYVPGKYNARNAVMAYIVCHRYGLGDEIIKQGLRQFKGSNRRLEKIAEINNILFYDDYAHHPEEIKAVATAVKEAFPEKRSIFIFQPHTYSRTKTLLNQFSESFSEVDCVIVTDIFASAREKADPTISGKILADQIKTNHQNVVYIPKDEIVEYVVKIAIPEGIIVTIGAGDVYKLHHELISRFSQENQN